MHASSEQTDIKSPWSWTRDVSVGREDAVWLRCRFSLLWAPAAEALGMALKQHPGTAWPLIFSALSSTQKELLSGHGAGLAPGELLCSIAWCTACFPQVCLISTKESCGLLPESAAACFSFQMAPVGVHKSGTVVDDRHSGV